MKNILLVDRNDEVVDAFIEIFKQTNLSIRFFRFHHEAAEGRIKHLLKKLDPNDKWIDGDGTKKFDLRLRHGGDYSGENYEKIPKAIVNICYGGKGYKDDRKREDEEIFYAPLKMKAGAKIIENFDKEEAQNLISYIEGRSVDFPKIFLPSTYDRELEEKLKEQYQDSKFNWNDIITFLDQVWSRIYQIKTTDKLFRQYTIPLKTLVLWRKEPELEYNILQHPQLKICTEDKFLGEEDLENYPLIFICAELDWMSNFYTEFEGVEMVNKLRRNNYRGLIVVVSFTEWAVFKSHIKKYPAKFKILETPFTWYLDLNALQLNVSDMVMEKEKSFDYAKIERLPYPRLSEYGLNDIQYYVLDWEGLLKSTFHGLKGRIGRLSKSELNKANTRKQILDHFFQEEVRPLLAPGKEEQLYNIRKKIDQKIDDDPNLDLYFDTIEKEYSEVEQLLPGSQEKTEAQKSQPWGVLYVEDFDGTRQKVKSILNESGITCFLASTGWKAIDLLKQDAQGKLPKEDGTGYYEPNFIVILLADYRMMHPGGHWQTFQGYDLIHYVNDSLDNFLAYAILTDKRGTILKEARRKSTLQISWFSKELLSINDKGKYFGNELIELGQDVFNASEALSENEVWNKGYPTRLFPPKSWYAFYRVQENYKSIEREINEITERFLKLVDALCERDEAVKLDKPAQKIRDLESEIIQIRRYIQNQSQIPLTFLATLTDSPQENPKKLKNFTTVLLGRRIVIALVNIKYYELKKITTRSKIFIDDNENENLDPRIRSFIENILRKQTEDGVKPVARLFNGHLAFPYSDWKDRSKWLPEERIFVDKWPTH